MIKKCTRVKKKKKKQYPLRINKQLSIKDRDVSTATCEPSVISPVIG